MPQIIRIKESKKISQISDRVHSTSRPIFVIRNGYGDLVIMSVENFERYCKKIELYESLEMTENRLKLVREQTQENSCQHEELNMAYKLINAPENIASDNCSDLDKLYQLN